MNTQIANAETALTRTQVESDDRNDLLPRYVGNHFLMVEGLIYDVMKEFCEAYNGGYWEMWELSNGAFYMTPPDSKAPYDICCVGNWYDGRVSADAAGIIVCLIAFNRAACYTRDDRFIELFYQLRDWACEHPESAEIFAAID